MEKGTTEKGTTGQTRQAHLDALSREASEAVHDSAERLRAVMDALHEAYGADLTPAELGTADAALDRIDSALRGLHGMTRLLESMNETVGQPGAATMLLLPTQAETAWTIAVLEAREQERSRLAEELHDGPAQTLANAIFQIEILSRGMADNGGDPAGELSKMRKLLQRELDMLRAYISQLRPPLAEPEELDEALRDSATSLTEYTSIPVDIRLDAPATLLEEPGRMVALRVAQEALRNIGKHSGAQRAWLITRYEARPSGDVWIMEVGDDGRGFDVDAAGAHENRRHFGLRFMRERADLLGSQLFIETAPGAGALVRLIIGTGGERS
jgi:signal transduction histidine kinase